MMSGNAAATGKIHFIAGTHWDREWRYTAEQSRHALTQLIDDLLEILETNPDFRYFHLDGGTVALEDYAETHPENVERLRGHVASGRIQVVPWYTLPETATVRDEALVRNLLMGTRVGERFGGVMRVGYNATGNGQISQMPQLYGGFGIGSILFYRGINADVVPPAFLWEAPDGTRALTIRLFDDFTRTNFFFLAYRPLFLGSTEMGGALHDGNGLYFRLAGDREEDINSYYQCLAPRRQYRPEAVEERFGILFDHACRSAVGPHMLWMNAEDNATPASEITRALADARRVLPGCEIVFDSLANYIADVERDPGREGMEVRTGEMRYTLKGKGWNGLFPGVIAERIYLKQKNEAAETALIDVAEPLAVAAAMTGMPYPQRELTLAWRWLLQNHSHDSINACANDKVHRDVMARFDQSIGVSQSASRRALRHLATRITVPGGEREIGLILFNTLARTRAEGVECFVDVPRGWEATQVDVLDDQGRPLAAQVLETQPSKPVVESPIDTAQGCPGTRVFLSLPAREVGGYGYRALRVRATQKARRPRGTVKTGRHWMENEFVRVELHPNGSLTLIDKASGARHENLHVFEDRADTGLAWHFETVGEAITTEHALARVQRVHRGPLLGRFRIRLRLDIPEAANYEKTERLAKTIRHEIVTEISLRAGSPRLEFRTTVENRCRDHRLRVRFGTGLAAAEHHWADSKFDVIRRPIRHPDTTGWGEPYVPTQPMSSFVDVSDGQRGLAVLTRGLREQEVFDDEARTVAITLLRANRHQMYPNYDPPAQEMEIQLGAQCLGPHAYEYAVVPHAGDWESAGILAEAHAFRCPQTVALITPHAGDLPPVGRFVEVEGEGVAVSGIKRAEDSDAVVVRLYNPGRQARQARLRRLTPIGRARELTLEEKPVRDLDVRDGTLEVPVPGGKIVTVELA